MPTDASMAARRAGVAMVAAPKRSPMAAPRISRCEARIGHALADGRDHQGDAGRGIGRGQERRRQRDGQDADAEHEQERELSGRDRA